MVPLCWALKMDEEPQVVFTSAMHDVYSHGAAAAASGGMGVPSLSAPSANDRRFSELRLERRRVVGAMKRAGLHLRRHVSTDGHVRYTCVSATEGRLMMEAHRLGMEKRLRVACMPLVHHDWHGSGL